MSSWSIKWRILFLALVPLAILSLLLSFYFINVRLNEIQQSLRDRGHTIARQLAPAAEYGVFTRNRELLLELTDAARKEVDVSLVTISNAAGEMLAVSGDFEQRRILIEKPHAISLGLLEYPDLLYFSEPIQRSVVNLDELADLSIGQTRGAALENKALLGWVNITMSKASTLERQQQILLNSGLITLASVVFAALLALRMTLGITRPIRRLAGAVEQITQGDLDVQVSGKAGSELTALASGINSMTRALKTAQDNLQERIDSATAQISYQATHDTLTGLINRHEFEMRLERALAVHNSMATCTRCSSWISISSRS